MSVVRAQVIPNKELFRDDDSGFKIYSADVKSSEEDIEMNNYGNISIKGDNLPDFNLGAVYDLELEWNASDKYKGSYNMVKSYFVKPQTAKEQWKYLSMIVTEIQYSSISRTYEENSDKIIDIINDGEFEFSKVDGYGKASYDILKEKVSSNMEISEALAYFSEYDIGYNTIKRLVDKYGSAEKTIQVIEENPYSVIEKDGFGFIQADDLAMKLGVKEDAVERIQACLIFVLDDIANNGDIWIDRKKLYNKMKKLLKIRKNKIDDVIDSDMKEVFVYQERYATYWNAKDEMDLSFMIADKVLNEKSVLSKVDYNPEKFIEKFESKNGMSLSEEQRSFLYKMQETNLLFLIGNGGTGKSILQKVVIDIAEGYGLTYALLAPTGKASRVLKNYTGREAYTIHKRIGYGLPKDMQDEVVVGEDIVLVDEASMADINIARRLMSVVKKGSMVVFIGDDAQIPSVGEGNFLFDSINFEEMPVVKLTKVFRQKESGMLDSITKTRQGVAFLNNKSTRRQRRGNNFEFRHMMKERIVRNILESYRKMIDGGYDIEDIAVLTPTNIGEVGAIQINKALQEEVNPNTGTYRKNEYTFGSKGNERTIRVGDFVMNTENMYDAKVENKAEIVDVFNGESGIVISVLENSKEIIVDFQGDHVVYSFSEATQKLTHAWAITIHKSQGSQFKVVLAVVDASATYQINANLLYTAMSRAEEYLGVFGQAVTFNRALNKFASHDRNSFLNEFYKIAFETVEARTEKEKEHLSIKIGEQMSIEDLSREVFEKLQEEGSFS